MVVYTMKTTDRDSASGWSCADGVDDEIEPSWWNRETVRELRRKTGLTQYQFAALVGCHRQAVASWETGKRTPTGLYERALDDLDRKLRTSPAS